jgi:hypothetical protein
MATAAERMRALRERARRGLRRLTIDVSENDLHAIAKRDYEGAVTTDHDQQAQAVGLFLTDDLQGRARGDLLGPSGGGRRGRAGRCRSGRSISGNDMPGGLVTLDERLVQKKSHGEHATLRGKS